MNISDPFDLSEFVRRKKPKHPLSGEQPSRTPARPETLAAFFPPAADPERAARERAQHWELLVSRARLFVRWHLRPSPGPWRSLHSIHGRAKQWAAEHGWPAIPPRALKRALLDELGLTHRVARRGQLYRVSWRGNAP